MATPLERLQQNRQNQMFNLDTTSGVMQRAESDIAQREAQILQTAQELQKQRAQEQFGQFNENQLDLSGYNTQPSQDGTSAQLQQMQSSGNLPPVTQTFGQGSKYDVFSGGVNYGVDFGVKSGTPVGLPPGQWQVVEAFSGADNQGYIGNKTNRGYGNSVLVRNPQTGETLRLSHLSQVRVQPGQVIPGGTVIGASGASGNVTGAHLDVEYRDKSGRLNDVLRTPYAQYLTGTRR